MNRFLKFSLLLATSAQLTSCVKDKIVDKYGSHVADDYFSYAPQLHKASRITKMQNDSLGVKDDVIHAAMEVREDDHKGGLTDSITPRIFGRYYPQKTYDDGDESNNMHVVPAHIVEMKEWRYLKNVRKYHFNNNMALEPHIVSDTVYRTEVVRDLKVR